jgi:predicted acyl esterase
VNVDPLELEWFDTWLKGEKTGMARTPTPLHYYDLGSGNFTETARYPFTGATPTRLYFGPGGTLTPSAPPASGTSSSPIPGLPLPVPTLPAATGDTLVWSPSGVPCGRPIDQWSMGGLSVPAGSAGFLAPCATDDRLTQTGPWATNYTSAPMTRATTLAGPVTATVYASATTSETQLVAELEEVTPDGTSYPLTEGALLGSLRAVNAGRSWTSGGLTVLPYHPYTQASAQPVSPGTMTDYQIQIFPTLVTIASGDRLRLTLSTADTPHLTPLPPELPNLLGGVYTIGRTADAPSSLTFETLG